MLTALVLACLQAAEPNVQAAAAPFGFAFECAPLLELHCQVSAHVVGPSSGELPAALEPAAVAARSAAKRLRGTERLRLFNWLVGSVSDARALKSASESLTEYRRTIDRNGEFAFASRVEWRSTALAYAAALAEVEPDFLADFWPARERRLRARMEELISRVGDGSELIEWALSRLDMELPPEPTRIVLVGRAPENFITCNYVMRDSFTILPLTRPDGSLRDDSEVLFLALQGALHKHEERFRGRPTLPGIHQPLRELFDLDETEQLIRMASLRDQVTHVTAEEAVRSVLELPASQRFPLLGEPDAIDLACREIWRRHLQGELDLQEALGAIRDASGF